MDRASVKEDRDDLLVYKSIDLNQLTRIRMMGLPIDNLSRDETLAYILAAIEKKDSPRHILFLDPIKLFAFRFKPSLKPIMKHASLVLADGGGLVWASRRLGRPLKERISMTAVILDIMRLSMRSDFTVYLMGSQIDHVNEVFFNFQRNFPNVRVIGRQGTAFSQEQEKLIKESLRKSAPDIIFLGMKFPLQELWIKENKKYLGNSVIVGIDNSFEILSGLSKVNPDWVQTRGIDWLWYSLKHPWRLLRFFVIFCFYFYALFFSLFSFRRRKKKRKAPEK